MQKVYFFVQFALCFCTVFPKLSQGQDCSTFGATFTTYESRCAATGAISVQAFGGSGSYKYKTTGPVNTNFTTSDSITGLSAGNYTITINDLVTDCTFTQTNVVVAGSYQDPRFTLTGVSVSCDNGNNGSITVNGQQFGRSPFAYTIVAPSPYGVGTTNSTGMFSNLRAGDYSIRMTDSCGGIQTRSITLNNYTWWIDWYAFNKFSCDSASGYVKVIDSRGNVSTLGPIPGFTYGVVRNAGDTVWSSNSNFSFYVNGVSSVDVLARDACGIIKKGNNNLNFIASVGNVVNVTNKTCSDFTASLSNIANFMNGDFCLYNSSNVQIACNASGVFNNLPYGTYCIRAHNPCPDTTISRCFTATPPPISVGNNIAISNKNCTSFTASVTGQAGLTNPDYCLYTAADVAITCNSTGVFTNLNFGSYCIKITDGCQDTTIVKCFSVQKPHPLIPSIITPTYADCRNIRIITGGDSLFAPQYCLYDTAGVVIKCNTTGVFDSLTIGSHCITIYDACYDTTIRRCFTVGKAVIANDLTSTISNQNCSTFTVRINSNNLIAARYCLYTQNDSLLRCNTTGVFDTLKYGAYCVKARNSCPDTLLTYCFTSSAPVPYIDASVFISNKACATFTATITGQYNLTNPQFCILNSANVQLSCNATGVFNNLPYGSYCIKTINSCYDTIINRCFTALAQPVDILTTTNKSCSYGYATVSVLVTGGSLPVNIRIYKPDSNILFNRSYNLNNIDIDSIPGLATGQTYRIIATDNCGNADTTTASVTVSIATHAARVVAQCPSAAWQNGSGKIEATTTTNMGLFTVKIIKKDGANLSPEISPNTASGGVFTFNDLGTGTYILNYKLNDACNRYLYDTVYIKPYYYPNLNRSSAYQCDISGFSVGAVASNGVGPFSYSIIGSTPSVPSIIAAPQSNPVFSINNGNNYSLIRLRALDACGNATLGDASILPMANYRIEADSNCFQSSSTLSVDTIYNATYAWYKKGNNPNDSTFLGSGYNINIPFVGSNDTGNYVSHVTVNTGCVKRSYTYHLTGMCYQVLPVKLVSFTAKLNNGQVIVKWKAQLETDLNFYVVERKNSDGSFTEIAKVTPQKALSGQISYTYVDANPETGFNFYRLRLIYNDHSIGYSEIISVDKIAQGHLFSCYPNPVSNILSINFSSTAKHTYKIKLLNMQNQAVWQTTFTNNNNNIFKSERPSAILKGIYILKCVNMNTGEEYARKVIFL